MGCAEVGRTDHPPSRFGPTPCSSSSPRAALGGERRGPRPTEAAGRVAAGLPCRAGGWVVAPASPSVYAGTEPPPPERRPGPSSPQEVRPTQTTLVLLLPQPAPRAAGRGPGRGRAGGAAGSGCNAEASDGVKGPQSRTRRGWTGTGSPSPAWARARASPPPPRSRRSPREVSPHPRRRRPSSFPSQGTLQNEEVDLHWLPQSRATPSPPQGAPGRFAPPMTTLLLLLLPPASRSAGRAAGRGPGPRRGRARAGRAPGRPAGRASPRGPSSCLGPSLAWLRVPPPPRRPRGAGRSGRSWRRREGTGRGDGRPRALAAVPGRRPGGVTHRPVGGGPSLSRRGPVC